MSLLTIKVLAEPLPEDQFLLDLEFCFHSMVRLQRSASALYLSLVKMMNLLSLICMLTFWLQHLNQLIKITKIRAAVAQVMEDPQDLLKAIRVLLVGIQWVQATQFR